MPTSFSFIRARLLIRIGTLDKAFERYILSPSVTKRVDRFALQEGLISSLWQAWCEFCRDAVIGATRGANTTTGTLVNSPTYAARTEAEIAFVAKLLAQSQTVGNIKSVSGRHQEPTWGDVAKLNLILNGLAPSNLATMLSGFSGVDTIKDLQVCRNANAHLSSDTIKSIKAAKVRYKDTDFAHPSDVMKWTDKPSNDYLWRAWIDEMDFVSDLVTL